MTAKYYIQSCKGFAANQPPLLVFTMCILAFGLTTVVLAFIVRESELPNPDVAMDWNIFMTRLTKLEACLDNSTIQSNSNYVLSAKNSKTLKNSTNNSTTISSSDIPLVELSLSELLPDISQLKSSDKNKDTSVNITKNILVPITFGSELLHLPPTLRWLNGTVTGRHLGLQGNHAKESLSVSMFIPYFNRNLMADRCSKSKEECKVILNTCLVFFGPSSLLPKTKQPQSCGKIAHYPKPVTVMFQRNKSGYQTCVSKTSLKMSYSINPDYTVMLSLRDRSLVNLHLMHTSYFLFIIVVTMLGYALLRGHFRKNISLDKVTV